MEFTYDTCVNYLLDIPRFSKKTSADNLTALLARLGNPQLSFQAVHVAGTNGKGSVCAYIASVLQHAGYKTGLFTSPHLVKVNERIRIDGIPVSDEQFLESFLQMKKEMDTMAEAGHAHPSFFECMFVLAMLCFQKAGVSYGVLETGLGGRLDATNCIQKPKLTVITPIALDHTEILGDTIAQIAGEKGGIIKPGVPLVYDDEQPEASRVFQEIAGRLGNEKTLLHPVGLTDYKIIKKTDKDIDFYCCNGYYEGSVFTVPFMATYQCLNARLAVAAIEQLLPKLDYSIVYEGIRHTHWEGRMEQVLPGVFFDGGLNLNGIQALMDTVADMPGTKILLFSVVQEKNYGEMIRCICNGSPWKEIILTAVPNGRRLEPEILMQHFKQYTDTPIQIIEDYRAAYVQALRKKADADVLICTGSLYLIGALKEIDKGETL
jgi:dihydrofolate synthase/folylpolyglutamate synthase